MKRRPPGFPSQSAGPWLLASGLARLGAKQFGVESRWEHHPKFKGRSALPEPYAEVTALTKDILGLPDAESLDANVASGLQPLSDPLVRQDDQLPLDFVEQHLQAIAMKAEELPDGVAHDRGGHPANG